jgi:hypothetical protein
VTGPNGFDTSADGSVDTANPPCVDNGTRVDQTGQYTVSASLTYVDDSGVTNTQLDRTTHFTVN